LFKGDASAEDVEKLEKDLEEKVDEDDSGIWQRIFDRFTSLKHQGMYNEARDYAEKMLSSSLSAIKEESNSLKSADEIEEDYRARLRQKDVVENIKNSYAKFGWFTDPIKKTQMSILLSKAENMPDVTSEALDKIEEELQELDSEAEMTSDSSYELDDSIQKMITAQTKLRNIAMETKDKINGWIHPLDKLSINNLVNDLTTTSPEQLSDDLIVNWNNRLSEFKESGVEKVTEDDIAATKEEREQKEAEEAEQQPVSSGLFDAFKKKTGAIGSNLSFSMRKLPFETAVSLDKKGNIFDVAKGSMFGASVSMPKGGTVIHNHPDGSPVSETDMKSAKESGLSSMITLTPDKVNDSIVKPVSSGIFDSIKRMFSPSTRSDQLDKEADSSRERHRRRSSLFSFASDSEGSKESDGEMTLDMQTQIISEKLDNITNAVNEVRSSTIEAGEGITTRINTAQNTAVARSMAYSNSAIATTRPKPKEPGLKPPSVDVARPLFA
jgi:hypothetical protein